MLQGLKVIVRSSLLLQVLLVFFLVLAIIAISLFAFLFASVPGFYAACTLMLPIATVVHGLVVICNSSVFGVQDSGLPYFHADV